TGYPQLHARVQEATVSEVGVVDSYLFYIEGNATTAVIARTHGAQVLNDLVDVTLTPNMVVGERYRLRFKVQGADPVSLDGIIEHFVSPNWMSIGEATFVHSDALRIDGPGTVGFSGSQDDTDPYIYDNFTESPL
ncbi:MAG: hypothetical protein ABI461_14940, partial [Polyangiaceae bacterium]